MLNTAKKLANCKEVIAREYSRRHSYPWVVAYSGGKDSTLLLQIVWEILTTLPKADRHRKVYVIGNDTLVESPLVINHLRASLDIIAQSATSAGLPISTRITRPHIDQTFWVNVIGRGYIPPTRNFRWCTDRMKIVPSGQLLEALVKRHSQAILLVGTRKSESAERRRNMAKRRVSSKTMNAHGSIRGCRVFAPLADLDDEDVWKVLMQRPAPWGGTHRDLITLYRNGGWWRVSPCFVQGRCPIVRNNIAALRMLDMHGRGQRPQFARSDCFRS